MPDCLLRNELLESERWLWLPSDTDRLCFTGLLLRCDDFGNLEAGIRRLFRFFHSFTQVKTEEAAATTMTHLTDADLARTYMVEKREFLHIPRYRSHRSYLVRKCPPSPWCNADTALGKHVRKVTHQGLAKNLPVTLPQRNSDVLLEVGVGVEVGVDKKRTSTAAPVDKSSSKPSTWAEHWTAKGKALGINPNPGETNSDYCRRVHEFAKSLKAKS